ncbi:hypothetical protein J25TS5_46990 [Paenibacillus faecis]|uniref:hypothetical protein n=1 Tax=Paenibacillus faecis TaxID=862114 RepID=UPI001B09AC1D|nr:hypothetical protein [Paenibacillus faecis]GIO87767.1 hypothetical protein J25TS5_46990 [Paenibacillus faecis]
MKTALEQLRRGLSFDFKLQKQPVAGLVVLIFLLYLIGILSGDPNRPRMVYYFSEMGMFPLVIMMTLVMFQRELGGGGMEMIATYPVSLHLIALRKWLLALGYASVLNVGWMLVYLAKFGEIKTLMYPWSGGEGVKVSTGIPALMLQNLPAFMLLSSLTLAGMLIFRKTYGGLVSGFSVWVLDTISRGDLLKGFTLYTEFLPVDGTFVANRLVLLAGAGGLLGFSLWLIGKRERWILEEEE